MTRNITDVLVTVSRQFNVSMHSDVYESIGSKMNT